MHLEDWVKHSKSESILKLALSIEAPVVSLDSYYCISNDQEFLPFNIHSMERLYLCSSLCFLQDQLCVLFILDILEMRRIHPFSECGEFENRFDLLDIVNKLPIDVYFHFLRESFIPFLQPPHSTSRTVVSADLLIPALFSCWRSNQRRLLLRFQSCGYSRLGRSFRL